MFISFCLMNGVNLIKKSAELRLDVKAEVSGNVELQHFLMHVLRKWTQVVTTTNLQNRSLRSMRKEVPKKSYWCGKPPGFWLERRNGERKQIFLSNLADKLSSKNGESYASSISWLRTRISFDILWSVHTCPSARTPFHKNVNFLDDFSVNVRNVYIFKFIF